MASPPPNPDTRSLPYGWVQQYNWEYRQWFYVNTREQPPRSHWQHPEDLFPPPPGPPLPDRGYNRSPYGGPPPPPPPPGYGGYPGYQPSYGAPPPPQGYGAPSGGYAGGSYGPSYVQERVYVDEQQQRKQRKGPGLGTALLAGGAGLVGGALLMDAVEDHNEREREIGYDQGFQDGWDDNQVNNWGDDGGFF